MGDLQSPTYLLEKTMEESRPPNSQPLEWNGTNGAPDREFVQTVPFYSQQTSAYQSRKRVCPPIISHSLRRRAHRFCRHRRIGRKQQSTSKKKEKYSLSREQRDGWLTAHS